MEDLDENAVTVTGKRYREVLENFVQPEIANISEYWWQQDGATARTARATMQMLTGMFQDPILLEIPIFHGLQDYQIFSMGTS